jgi:hypothetical protein
MLKLKGDDDADVAVIDTDVEGCSSGFWSSELAPILKNMWK